MQADFSDSARYRRFIQHIKAALPSLRGNYFIMLLTGGGQVHSDPSELLAQ